MHLLLVSFDSHRVQKIIVSEYLILIMTLFYKMKWESSKHRLFKADC